MIETYYPQVERVGVAFWDLNDLKKINDKFGHAMGDRAIGKLSSLLLSEAPETCRVYRIGGDEFVTITDNPAPEQMTKMASDILKQVQEANESEPFLFSVAVGYALGKGTDIHTVVKAADTRMYANKNRSKETQKQ